MLDYSTEHLKVPGNYRQLFVKDRKRKASFFKETTKYHKGRPCIIAGKYANLYQNT